MPLGTDYRTTWEYDGVNWVVKPTVNAPLTGYRTGIVYDDARGHVVLYGGYASATVQQTGDRWRRVSCPLPASAGASLPVPSSRSAPPAWPLRP